MRSAALLLLAALVAGCAPVPAPTGFTELRRLPAAEANQGVAIDADHYYAIADAALGKYRKADGA
mgnify:CR=1 FL=1